MVTRQIRHSCDPCATIVLCIKVWDDCNCLQRPTRGPWKTGVSFAPQRITKVRGILSQQSWATKRGKQDLSNFVLRSWGIPCWREGHSHKGNWQIGRLLPTARAPVIFLLVHTMTPDASPGPSGGLQACAVVFWNYRVTTGETMRMPS